MRKTDPNPIELDADDYWNQIETNPRLSTRLKDALKAIVNCHIHQTIPPESTGADVMAFVNAGLGQVVLKDGRRRETLTVVFFRPRDTATQRQFIYLGVQYPGGDNIPVLDLLG